MANTYPSWPAFSPWTVPTRLTSFGRFPQSEISAQSGISISLPGWILDSEGVLKEQSSQKIG